jgi:hypothetical protein
MSAYLVARITLHAKPVWLSECVYVCDLLNREDTVKSRCGDMPADYTKTVIAIEELMSNTD